MLPNQHYVNYVKFIGNSRDDMMTRIDVDDQISLLDPDERDSQDIQPELEDHQSPILAESMAYDPGIGNIGTPIGTDDRDITDLNQDHPGDDPLLNTEVDRDEEPSLDPTPEYIENYVPSEIVDYFDESTLRAAQRNALDDDEFGLPRLRAYPLTDETHVKQAARMFGHCKDPKDRRILARNIFRRAKELGVELVIGKKNALYDYAPKALQESSGPSLPRVDLAGFEVESAKRTKEQIVAEHIRVNAAYYNHLFYSPDYVRSLKAIKRYEFFNFFYPDVRHISFYVRMKSALGGLGMNTEYYHQLGMRAPLETDFTKPVRVMDHGKVTDFQLEVISHYESGSNWYGVDLSKDLDHIEYCLQLYSILGDMLLNPNFSLGTDLGPMELGILTDWSQRVVYHYDWMKEYPEYSDEWVREVQYLYDLCWCHLDHPLSEDDINANIMAFANTMVSTGEMVTSRMNESGELVSKEDTVGYLVKELGLGDDLFLLPSTMEYPIINRGSVRLAMDMINRIPKDQVLEFVRNLNRKYRELGCTFSISVDHPYARYADKNIVDHMCRILTEGDTVVGDDAPANDIGGDSSDPWFKRSSSVELRDPQFYPDREMGPSSKHPKQDVTRTGILF